MKSGIYAIINAVNGKFYVGSSQNIKERWARHQRDLRKGIHRNKHLRRAWKKYGEGSFYFGVLEPVEDLARLTDREQYWMDLLKPEYNILPTAGSSLGFRFTEEQKQKLSGENNPMFGWTGENSSSYKHAKCWEYNGRSQRLIDWAKEYGIDKTSLSMRVNSLGWAIEKALSTPAEVDRKGENNPSYQHAKCWEYNGKSQPLSAWAKEYGINRTTLSHRVNRDGWPLERALLTPVRPRISLAAKKKL